MEFLEINTNNHCSKITDSTNKRIYGEVKQILISLKLIF